MPKFKPDAIFNLLWYEVTAHFKDDRLFIIGSPPSRSLINPHDFRYSVEGAVYRNQHEADDATARFELKLANENAGPSNVRNQIMECFSELATNAVQHSIAQQPAFGTLCIIRDEDYIALSIAVVDTGIGIRTALEADENNRIKLRCADDAVVIEYATQFGVTGTGEHRGIGLFSVKEAVLQFGGALQIVSGSGSLIVRDGEILRYSGGGLRRRFQLNGTMVLMALYIPAINR